MPRSAESLLQLLQRFIKNSIQINQIHSLIITNGHLLCIPNHSSFKWSATLLYNTLIRAYLNIHLPHTTLLLFTHMLRHNAPPNAHTFPSLAIAASSLTPSPAGKSLHAQALKRGVLADPFVQTSFLNLYAQSGCVDSARKVFDEMPEPCVVSWNALLDGFCKNGNMGSAVLLFERMPVRDVYSWTNLVNGHAKNGCPERAIQFFMLMMMAQRGGQNCFVKPNEASFVSVLSACAITAKGGGLFYGKQIHGYIIKNEDRITVFVGTALISLYGKIGDLGYAIKVFETMVKKEVCTWNAMIGALATNGEEKHALNMFKKMKVGGWRPNEVTFVVILAACARAKLVELGLESFNLMSKKFGIFPQMEHYGCVVDLLGKAGLLAEANEFVEKMPFEPDASVLGTLLGACKVHGAIDLGIEVARRLLELRPRQCGQYMMLWSIYAEAEKWNHAASLRNAMVDAGIQKPSGYSLIKAM